MLFMQLLMSCLVLLLLLFFAMVMNRGVFISILAGALTGLSEGTVMFPLENLKVQQQLDGCGFGHAIRRTYSTYGILGFFRGLTPVLIGAIPSQAIRWGCFEAYCGVADCHHNLWHVAMAGIISGLVNSCVTGVPTETSKTSMIHSYWSHLINNNNNNNDNKRHDRESSSVVVPVTIPCQSYTDVSVLTEDNEILEDVRPIYVNPSQTVKSHNSDLLHSKPSDVIHPFPLCNYREMSTMEDGNIVNMKSFFSNTSAHSRVFTMPQYHDVHIPATTTAEGNWRPTSLLRRTISMPNFRSSDYNYSNYFPAFRGLGPTLLKKIINQGVRFPIHAWSLSMLCLTFSPADIGLCKYNHAMLNFAAGTFAGFSTIFITHPIDVAKTRMQGLDGHRFRHTIHCINTIISEDGYCSLTHGLLSRTLRVSIGVGISFMVFPFFQSSLRELFSATLL